MGIIRSLLGCSLVLALTASQLQGAIITPTSAVASSQFAAAVNTINGSGLDGIGPVASQLHSNDENHLWQSFSSPSSGNSIEFTLDQVYDLSDAHIWQYSGLVAGPPSFRAMWREVEDLDISISPDLVSPYASLGTKTLNAASNPEGSPLPSFTEPAQSFALAGANLARRVKITILTTYDAANDDGFAGLSEVRFEGTAIPEPTTLALGAMALCSLPWIVRRKRG